jgi:hypothetical protein
MVPSSACDGKEYGRLSVPSVVTCLRREPSGLYSHTLMFSIRTMLLATAWPGASSRAARPPRTAVRRGAGIGFRRWCASQEN